MPFTTLEKSETAINGFSHADKVRFLELFAESKNPFTALDLLGVSYTTYYDHLQRDEWFNREVHIAKKRLAWTRTPRLLEIADGNTGANVTANIWLQKVLGGDEFNPDRRLPDVAVVALTYAPTVIDCLTKPSLLPLPTLPIATATETRRRHQTGPGRRCHCGRRGPHKSACLERQQRRESTVLGSKGCGLEERGGSGNVPQVSHPPPTQKALPCP